MTGPLMFGCDNTPSQLNDSFQGPPDFYIFSPDFLRLYYGYISVFFEAVNTLCIEKKYERENKNKKGID